MILKTSFFWGAIKADLITHHEKELVLKESEVDQVKSAEALWMLKVAESDYFLTSCDNSGKLFMRMFAGNIFSQFQLGRAIASYVVSDGLSPCILYETVKDIKNYGTGYTAMFDETTTNQNKK